MRAGNGRLLMKAKASGREVPQERIDDFLARLAECCNMSRAAREAGVSRSMIYRLRARDAAFAAAWADAIEAGYERLELGLIEAALARVAEHRAVPLLWQHRAGANIGVIETLAEDARGLRVVARVTHPVAAKLVEQGALTGLSFGYRVRAARGDNPRELLALDLAEVSLVAAPMQPLARVIALENLHVAPAKAGAG